MFHRAPSEVGVKNYCSEKCRTIYQSGMLKVYNGPVVVLKRNFPNRSMLKSWLKECGMRFPEGYAVVQFDEIKSIR